MEFFKRYFYLVKLDCLGTTLTNCDLKKEGKKSREIKNQAVKNGMIKFWNDLMYSYLVPSIRINWHSNRVRCPPWNTNIPTVCEWCQTSRWRNLPARDTAQTGSCWAIIKTRLMTSAPKMTRIRFDERLLELIISDHPWCWWRQLWPTFSWSFQVKGKLSEGKFFFFHSYDTIKVEWID